jgi:hypothetical protein
MGAARHDAKETTMAMKKKKPLPGPYAALTRDTRFAGTYEVLVPAPDRVKPHRVPLQFETLEQAETWIYSPEGVETIEDLLSERQR